MSKELQSVWEFTTLWRKSTGESVPPKLVGASTTVIGSCMYLFGGRLARGNEVVADLYIFNLETCDWAKTAPSPGEDVPRARYFHSADTWKNQLVIFGGMGHDPEPLDPDNLCVLNDVRFFDTVSRRWSPPSQPTFQTMLPRARFSHLSCISGHQLFIIGGRDIRNVWLTDVCVYDFFNNTWSEKRNYHRKCGSYDSIVVASNQHVCFPQESPSLRRESAGSPFRKVDQDLKSAEALNGLPYSSEADDENPGNIYLYSNSDCSDGKHGLELISPLPTAPAAAISGTASPPDLRFPTGAILGTHLIFAGIHFYHSYQSFAIWVLDLQTMVWSKLNPGRIVEYGSWSRGCLWTEENKFIIFGNRNSNLGGKGTRRFLSWDHVAMVDLEAFGIYQPPPLKLELPMQVFGVAALKEGLLADFEIVCDDGRIISCSRRLLEDRWPWFKEQMRRIKLIQESTVHTFRPKRLDSLPDDQRPDVRLSTSTFNLLESYPVTRALSQYFYSMALLTALQTAPAVLNHLLVLATDYYIPHLQSLVQHAMHLSLSKSTAAGVYETARFCGCRNLQIRALTIMLSSATRESSVVPPESHGTAHSEPEVESPPDTPRPPSIAEAPTSGSHEEDRNRLSSPHSIHEQFRRTHGSSVVSLQTEAEMYELIQLLSRTETRTPRAPLKVPKKDVDNVVVDRTEVTIQSRTMASKSQATEPQKAELTSLSKTVSIGARSLSLSRLRKRRTVPTPALNTGVASRTPREPLATTKGQRKTRTGELVRVLKERAPQHSVHEYGIPRRRDKREPAVMYDGLCAIAM